MLSPLQGAAVGPCQPRHRGACVGVRDRHAERVGRIAAGQAGQVRDVPSADLEKQP